MNIYAVYKYNMVTIVPQEQGGSDVPQHKFEKGQTWSDVKHNFPDPELEGNVFTHWSLEEQGEPIDDAYVFTKDEYKIYAQWSTDVVTIKFDADGGIPIPDPLYVKTGTTWGQIKNRVNSPQKDGVKCIGWIEKPNA